MAHPFGWLKPWLLYPIGAAYFLTLLLSTGILNQHPASGSIASGGQTYAIQVGGSQANIWQHDHPASIQTPQATSVPPQLSTAPDSVVARPSIQVNFINLVLSAYHSPAAGKGQALYDLGVQYGIDPAFALAFFMHESSFGTQGPTSGATR